MAAYIVMTAILAPLLVVAFRAGRARGIEDAGRRWLVVLQRVDSTYAQAHRVMNNAHIALEERLLGKLDAAGEHIRELHARLDGTAVPRERN